MEILKVAWDSVRTNKLRSFLTILGIVVGIFSIISISTIITILQDSIEKGVSSLGQNTFQIQKYPATVNVGHRNRGKFRNRKDITYDDFKRLREKLTDAKEVAVERWQFGRVVKFNGEETNPNVSFCGGSAGTFVNNNWNIAIGRAFNDRDVQRAAKVIVLGADIKNKLFKAFNPIGMYVKVDGHKLRVIGVLEKRGASFGRSQDNFVIAPITTFMTYYGKRKRSMNITVMAYNEEDYENLIEKARGVMRTIRKVPAGEPDDFGIFSNKSMMAQIDNITQGARIGSIAIALIALLAAGIGIMNIMLVSVTERTKEIGIRKAVGAKKSNILVQFLSEAILLSLSGGLIGILLGVIAGNVVGSMMNATAVFPLGWTLIGILLCVVVGVGFGTYPAYKASNLDPIEALRWE
jgi:putative ABC transport system permease protein